MNNWKEVKVSEFLTERKDRFKPNDPAISKFKRLDKIDFLGKIYLSDKSSKTNMIIIKKGDLVISGINVAKGAIAVYEGDEDIVATIHYSSYTVDKQKINVEYFKRFLKSPKFMQLLREQVKGGIKTEIKPKHLLSLEILLPDIQLQRSIVNFFERTENNIVLLDDEINNQHSLLTQLRQSILQEAVEGRLTAGWRRAHPDLISGEHHAARLLEKIRAEKNKLIKGKKIRQENTQESNYNYPLKIPNEWVITNVLNISKQVTDGTHVTPQYTDKGYVFLSAQNVKPFKFMPEYHKYISEYQFKEITRNKIPEEGDLLIARVGAGIGETAVIDKKIEFAFYVSLGLIKIFKHLISPNYLAIVFNSPYGVSFSKGNISSGGTSAGNYNLGRIRAFEIPLPSLVEQKVIVQKVNHLMKKIDLIEEQVKSRKAQAGKLMQAVLREAFSGEDIS